ncbi:NAD(+) diphosphatase [Paramagnetospirillum kuznetsovii]|uniref:NAD(+) diphosphatase n=1 Tax=Paramagnetospirillum kuznetsovii TaxID=2053833 RepID=A0A364NZ70_9PROT|nr:NAD(+) diphosphatase [Paramagnetospirillum kuznetsovii]RAU22371.1 NAD(+) diphosphatase [Paramagnetospirillum kuznetsovii]
MNTPILYSGLPLDRAHGLRRHADLGALARLPDARFSLYWRGRQLIRGNPPVAALSGGTPLIEQLLELDAPLLLLGLDGDSPVLASDLSALDGDEDGPRLTVEGRWVLLRSVGGLLPAADAALLAYARGMLIWREKTRFCSVCGTRLSIADGGHSAKCTDEACAALHFPRTDPAIIMLVTDPDGRALLGRQPVWAPGMYSCLAGFVEPGESLEEAVGREVWEEAGVRISSARYFASQPWPFPSSLMVGFHAEAPHCEPHPDLHEIEDVRWFTRQQIRQFGEREAPSPDGLFLPSRDSISRALIEDWLGG